MRYYKHLYLTEGLEKKKEKIIRKLEAGKLQPGVHVITLAVSERNQLEIYPTIQFKQPAFPEQELFVVGITKGYDEAVELVEQIVQETNQRHHAESSADLYIPFQDPSFKIRFYR